MTLTKVAKKQAMKGTVTMKRERIGLVRLDGKHGFLSPYRFMQEETFKLNCFGYKGRTMLRDKNGFFMAKIT